MVPCQGLGFNVLRNDAQAALALCAACGGSFIRVNVHTGAMLTDQGIIEGNAFETLRYRQRICPGAQIFADVHVKHAVPLGNWAIGDSARDAVERGLADALIVSGIGTGHAADCADCETKEGKIDRIERNIEIRGPLDGAQRQRLLEIAEKCPVHRTLHSEIKIASRLLAPDR